MDTVLYTLCAVAGWIGFGYVLLLSRRSPDSARRAMCVAIGSFAAGITIAIPPVSHAIDATSHLPNLAKVLAHAGAMCVSAGAEIMLLFLVLPPDAARIRGRRWIWSSSLAYVTMVALWGYTLHYHPPVELRVEYARTPAVTGYLLVFVVFGFLSYCMDIARQCWRFARLCGRPWLRRGMRITAIGAAFALLYCANKVAYLIGYLLGGHPGREAQVAAVLVTISALCMLVGLTIPAWGPLLTRAHTGWWRWRVDRQLRLLWSDITRACPQLVLAGGLHRRIVEIYDGRLALLRYVEADTVEAATALAARFGLTGDEARVAVEAALIAVGVWNARQGTLASSPAADPWHTPPGGYQGEVSWLVRVARAYQDSPVVARIRTNLPAAGPGAGPGIGAEPDVVSGAGDGDQRAAAVTERGTGAGPVRQP